MKANRINKIAVFLEQDGAKYDQIRKIIETENACLCVCVCVYVGRNLFHISWLVLNKF